MRQHIPKTDLHIASGLCQGNGGRGMNRKDYLKELFKISRKADLWILREIYKCALNMTKEG